MFEDLADEKCNYMIKTLFLIETLIRLAKINVNIDRRNREIETE